MTAPELVPIAEAARRLGVSADTVRRRLKRGELESEQRANAQGFTWLVAMPAGSGAAEGVHGVSGTHGVSDDGAAAVGAHEVSGAHEVALEATRLGERVAGLERLADELRGERDAWKAQAERHEEAARELRILVQGAQALARALPANVEDVDEDAPQRPLEASGRDERPQMGKKDCPHGLAATQAAPRRRVDGRGGAHEISSRDRS